MLKKGVVVHSTTLNCLYYPFSRLLDPNQLKHALLTFDSVTFLDEAENDWRAVLLHQMEGEAALFARYAELAADYDELMNSGAVRCIDPKTLSAAHSTQVAIATLADLKDRKFVELASQPQKHGLPSRTLSTGSNSSRPTWQVFQGKLASPLRLNPDLTSDTVWSSHVLIPGDEAYSWTLSYEAGSAAVLNYYFEAAQELGLTPSTSSTLHHHLLLRKLKRTLQEDGEGISLLDEDMRYRCRRTLGHGEILRLLGNLFPATLLQRATFRDILKFRTETVDQRRQFLVEVDEVVRTIDGDPSQAAYDKDVALAIQEMGRRFLVLQAELSGIRDRVLPSMAEGGMYSVAGGGALGALATFLGGLSTGGVVAASALTIGGTLALKASTMWTERRQTLRKEQSGVSYLLAISKMLG